MRHPASYKEILSENLNWEKEIALAFQKENKYIFKELLDKYASRILNFIYRSVSNKELAEDLTQEVFFKVYKERKRYQPKAKFSTYLYKIATNLCIDHQRKRKLKTVSLDRPINTNQGEITREFPDLSQETPAVLLEKKEINKTIQSALLSLPTNQRLALSLKVYDAKSYREISKILQRSVPAIKLLLFRARENLKSKLPTLI